MGTYEDLKQAISAVIKENNNQEITGEIMQSALLSIINNIGANATFAGIATPATTPGSPDANIFYLAGEPGDYVNFGGVTVQREVAILENSSGIWKVKTFGAATVKAVRDEQTRALTAETGIKDTMEKSCVSNNEEFNDVVKELYFDKGCSVSNIKKISIKRNGKAGNSVVWEMYFVDTNDTSHYVSFGLKAEQQDVNVGSVGWGTDKESSLFSVEPDSVNCYAVIDWNKVTNRGGTGTGSDVFQGVEILNKVNYNKYFPQINTCIATHKYTHDIEANSVVKELYFQNLTKNGYPISDYEFNRFFSLERIARNKLSSDGSQRVWSLVFFVRNPNFDTSIEGVDAENHFYKSINVSPENDIVVKMPMRTTLKYPNSEGILTDYIFEATTYAVIDWKMLKNEEDTYFNVPLLRPCLYVDNSPIIYSYIENEKMREQIAQLATSINTTSEE